MGNFLQRHISPNCVAVVVVVSTHPSTYHLSAACSIDAAAATDDGNRAICYIRASDDDDSTNTFFALASLRLIDILKAFVAAA